MSKKPPDPPEKGITDKADTIIAPIVDSIVAFQSDWMKTHKVPWQGIRTPATVPDDGADEVPDKNLKPSGKEEDNIAWKDVQIVLPPTMSCSLEVITHQGPKGVGYTIVASVTQGQKTFVKYLGFGEENLSITGWFERPPSPNDPLNPRLGGK